MDLRLSNNGEPICALIASLGGRKLKFNTGASGGHLIQLLSNKWGQFSRSLGRTIEDLDKVDLSVEPNLERLVEGFTGLTYDATELFDIYSIYLPKGLGDLSKEEQKILRGYKDTSKRLRDRWALICNKCKHSGSRLATIWMRVKGSNASCARFMVVTPQNGDSLLRDKDIHGRKNNGIGIAIAVTEMVHSLLRLDIAASKLVDTIVDRDGPKIPEVAIPIVIRKYLESLSNRPTFGLVDEGRLFDGFVMEEKRIQLKRCSVDNIVHEGTFVTTLQGDGITRTYSFM